MQIDVYQKPNDKTSPPNKSHFSSSVYGILSFGPDTDEQLNVAM